MDSALHPHMIDSYLTSCDHVGHISGQLLDTFGITSVVLEGCQHDKCVV